MQQIEPTLHITTLSPAIVQQIQARLGELRWACLSCSDTSELFASRVIAALGGSLDVYGDGHVWSDLRVRLDAAPNRTHGVGANPLHLDYVNRSHPPRWIALRGVQADPLGGGDSVLADLHLAAECLDDQSREALSQPVFKYWNDIGALHVGAPLDSFSVLPTEDAWTRFTAKMIPHLNGSDDVLTQSGRPDWQLYALSMKSYMAHLGVFTRRRRLQPGEILLFDQQRYAHGRCAMGQGQGSLEPGQRRLLQQAYCEIDL